MSAIYSYFKRKASKSQTICRCVPVLLALLLLLVFFAGCETEKLTSLRYQDRTIPFPVLRLGNSGLLRQAYEKAAPYYKKQR